MRARAAGAPRAPLLSPLVLAELDHLVRARLGAEAARLLSDDVAAGAYELVPLTADDVAACVRLHRQYDDLGLGLADASLVVLAQAAGTDQVLSLDERRRRAVVPLQGGHFRLLPHDSA